MKKTTRQVRREAQLRLRRIRSSIFALKVVGVLRLASFYLVKAFSRPTVEPLAGNVIEVAADMSGFDQKEIRVKAGQPVTIRMTSLDSQLLSTNSRQLVTGQKAHEGPSPSPLAG